MLTLLSKTRWEDSVIKSAPKKTYLTHIKFKCDKNTI